MNILRFVQDVDRSGQRFYEEMAQKAENPGVKHIFEQLASDEAMRLARLEARVAEVAAVDVPTLDASGNIYEQLRRHSEQIAVADDVAAYRLALDAEREIVRQYEQAADAEMSPAIRKILSEIAEDERHLLDELEQLYDFTNVPNSFLAWGEFSNLGEFHNFGRDVD